LITILLGAIAFAAEVPQANNIAPGPWSGENDIELTQGALASDKNINLPAEYSVKFTYKPTDRHGSYRHFFRVTTTNNNCCNKGDRAIAVWIIGNSEQLHFRLSSTKNGNDGMNTNYPFQKGQSYKVKFVVSQNRITLFVDYEPVQSEYLAGDA